MIDEAVGKILGMAMAYAVSGLGLFLAYANYRRRTVKAERIMTPAAWGVIGLVALAVVGGVVVVRDLARRSPAPAPAAAEVTLVDEAAPPPAAPPTSAVERPRWPLIGTLLPAAILLAATWITGWLYLHFSRGAATVAVAGDAAHDARRDE
jgi:hypothetical protein